MFDHVPAFAGDPILGLNEDFLRDPRPDKVNLSIGMYYDDAGRLPLLAAVREAELRLQAEPVPRPYAPMGGSPDYRRAVQELLFGEDHPAAREGRIATLQTLAGSGALRIGADFLRRYFPQSEVWVSDPTWENHHQIFESAGLRVHTYPYYDAATGGLRFEAMCEALAKLPSRSVVLLHACCHNPTGVDLSPAQWEALVPVLRERELIAFVDMAYQGFGRSIAEDAFALRLLAREGLTLLVSNSFSKIFSLYGERIGALSLVASSAEEAARVYGQLEFTVRGSYSTPPINGSRLVTTILTDATLRASWEAELRTMRERIRSMRRAIHDGLQARVSSPQLARYLTQSGMFTYTGLDPWQVEVLRREHGLYLLRSGRMCIAGLNARNLAGVVEAVAVVMQGVR